MTHEHQPGADHAQEESHGGPERRGEQEPALQPKIWVGSLLDYNNGLLHGDWIDAAQEGEALAQAARRVLATSPTAADTGEVAEEFGIFDFDDFGDWKPGEYEDLTVVATVARGIRQHGPAFAAWADLQDADPDMLAAFNDAYLGEFDSLDAWADSVMEESGSREIIERLVQEHVGDLSRYVRLDSDAWAQDVWLSGDISILHKDGGGVWIFNANP